MKLFDIVAPCEFPLLEVKARIEHPEDLVFTDGVQGIKRALQILDATARNPVHVSVKFDGSPALIFGWRGDEFILTDKAGFGAKGYDGMTTNPDAIESMIMGRKMKDTSPEAVSARKSYAQKIAGLYELLKGTVPRDFKGYVQGDLMFTETPPVLDGSYQFRPVKVTYRVPADSELGKRIGASRVGMVIHSVYESQADEEPEAVRDVRSLGFNEPPGLVILPHELDLPQSFKLEPGYKKSLVDLVKRSGKELDDFLNPMNLSDKDIKALPGVMKSFLAYKAGQGEENLDHAPEEFLSYIGTPASKVSAKMAPRIMEYVQAHSKGYNAVWESAALLVHLKMHLKSQIDQQVSGTVSASLRDKPGHEGFVSVTPHGIVKLVHRPHFMKKDTLTEAVDARGPRVVWTFARMNPPTLGHHKVVDKIVKLAQGGDYWIFLSHSQDPKENPLDWKTKMHFARLAMSAHANHFAHGEGMDKIRTPLLAADWLYNQGYRELVMVVGSDRVSSMTDILKGWNSPEIRGKYGREECVIEVVSAGDRDPDAPGVAGFSASKARSAAQEDNFTTFHKIVGMDDASALAMFDAVKTGLKKAAPKPRKLKEDEAHTHGTIVKLIMEMDSAQKLEEWCARRALVCMPAEDLHCTILFSKKPVPHLRALDGKPIDLEVQPSHWSVLGEDSLVLEFDHDMVHDLHDLCKRHGGEHSHPNMRPHSSVCYGWKHDNTPIEIPDFPLKFDTVVVSAIDPDWAKR